MHEFTQLCYNYYHYFDSHDDTCEHMHMVRVVV
jgi:hypothetical protein